MTKQEALELLKGGPDSIKKWNRWRRQQQRLPNLERVNLQGADLSGADLRGLKLGKSELDGAILEHARLANADLHEASLQEVSLYRADMRGAWLAGADIAISHLDRANLRGADLRRTELGESTFVDSNLTSAVLEGASLTQSVLVNVSLVGADLTEAYFCRTHLDRVDMTKAKAGGTTFACSLSKVTGLNSITHLWPSHVSMEPFRSFRGSLPIAFLRGCGLSDSEINYAASLLGKRPKYRSCFISYSHEDAQFAQQLYYHLQGRGIRCWLDTHDMKIGERILDAINHAIRQHDRVLLCCSKASLTSSWVEDEIAIVFEKERRDGGTYLIPLNLDGFLLHGWESGKAPRIRERLAADFTGYEEDDAKFDAQCRRIAQALRVESK